MSYQPLDVVIVDPKLGAKVYAIVSVDPLRPEAPYSAVLLDKGPFTRRYRLDAESILAKIGTLDSMALEMNPATFAPKPSADWELGQHFARYMTRRAADEDDRHRWALLADLKPGDPITIDRHTRRGGHVEQLRFIEVLPNGQKYHFVAANRNGTVYRWTLSSVHLCVRP